MKACSKCGCQKPDAEFHRDAQKKDGLRSVAAKGRHPTSRKNPTYTPAKHPMAKLTIDVVEKLRSRAHSPGELALLAAQLGVSNNTLRQAASGKTWSKQ